ncbi:MAG: hypothetical protein L0Z50_34165 [Verrucomicrobiales bacterium]|nr:hypothetical protein [Verrucomicrobiales bacterium]
MNRQASWVVRIISPEHFDLRQIAIGQLYAKWLDFLFYWGERDGQSRKLVIQCECLDSIMPAFIPVHSHA